MPGRGRWERRRLHFGHRHGGVFAACWHERDVATDRAAGHLTGMLGTDPQRSAATGTRNFDRHRQISASGKRGMKRNTTQNIGEFTQPESCRQCAPLAGDSPHRTTGTKSSSLVLVRPGDDHCSRLQRQPDRGNSYLVAVTFAAARKRVSCRSGASSPRLRL